MKKTAFTLSELMIALTVLGILCAILLPAIMNAMPNQNKIMMKRAYYTTATVVSDLINNPNLYPSINSSGDSTVGFDNTDSVTYGGNTYSGETKFIELFAAHLNIDGDIEDECSDFSIPSQDDLQVASWSACRTFTTPDGISWDLRTPSGTSITYGKLTYIYVDVNGDNKPNCLEGDTSKDCGNRTKNFDQFYMIVAQDGAITIPESQTWAREAIHVSSSLTD